jgi:4-hydroxyproline epimerase
MACLAADGLLKPGQQWRQEGILGTVFECSFTFQNGATSADAAGGIAGEGCRILPVITGSAHVTAESTLIFDPADPFRLGVPE